MQKQVREKKRTQKVPKRPKDIRNRIRSKVIEKTKIRVTRNPGERESFLDRYKEPSFVIEKSNGPRKPKKEVQVEPTEYTVMEAGTSFAISNQFGNGRLSHLDKHKHNRKESEDDPFKSGISRVEQELNFSGATDYEDKFIVNNLDRFISKVAKRSTIALSDSRIDDSEYQSVFDQSMALHPSPNDGVKDNMKKR